MSSLVFKDNFDDLRNWSGTGALDTINFFTSSPGVQAGILTSKRTFFDVEKLSIRFYDTLGSQYLALSLSDREILRFSGNTAYYTVLEDDIISAGTVHRSPGWHLLEIDVLSGYRVKVDGTTIYNTVNDSRQAFDVILSGGIWDDFVLSREYSDDYQGGTGTLDDLEIQDIALLDSGKMSYTIKPGYFYTDNIEYYHFANMSMYDFSPNPSGIVVGVSGLPYVPGQPYFIIDPEDTPPTSGYVRTPLGADYLVSWSPDPVYDDAYIPTISGAFDSRLVYEAGVTRDITIDIPLSSTKVILSDEGGDLAYIRSESSYIDYVKIGNSYQTFAEVLDKFGGPVSNIIVTWKVIDSNNIITNVATGVTNTNGIATTYIGVTESKSFHIYAEVDPTSRPRWIQVQTPVSEIIVTIFQLDNDSVRFDSQEGTSAMGWNIWHEEWATNQGEATGLSYPSPTTHGQWEALHIELRRPPINQELAVNESLGCWNGYDFRDTYSSIVGSVGTVKVFMSPMYVARNGYWGQLLVSGSDIRGGSPTVPAGQILNQSTTYEIDRDYGSTVGTFLDVQAAAGEYDTAYYVFYQPGNEYDGNSIDMSGNFYFRGIAVYEEDLSQANSQVQDIISEAELSD